MDFDRLVFPPAPAFLVAGLWYLLLLALAPKVGEPTRCWLCGEHLFSWLGGSLGSQC